MASNEQNILCVLPLATAEASLKNSHMMMISKLNLLRSKCFLILVTDRSEFSCGNSLKISNTLCIRCSQYAKRWTAEGEGRWEGEGWWEGEGQWEGLWNGGGLRS